MPKKPKTDKQLDKLFKDFQPEESASKVKSSPQVEKEAAPLTIPPPVQQKTEQAAPARPVKRHTAMLTPLEDVLVQEDALGTSSYSVNIPTGFSEWSTLRVMDETNERKWTPDEQLLVRQVSDQLSLALENARLFQEAQERAEELALINRVVSTLTGATSLQEALHAVIYEIVEAFPVARGAVTILDEDKQYLQVIADHSKIKDGPSAAKLKIPMEGNLATETVISTRKPYILENAANNPAIPPALQQEFRRLGITYTAIFPIIINELVVGTLGVDILEKDSRLNSNQIALLETTLPPISAAISRLRAEEALARSETDLRTLFSSMEDVVLVVDKDGRYVRIAPTNPSLLVRPPDELIGQLMHDVLPKNVADRSVSAIQQTLQGSSAIQLEYDLLVGDKVFWFLANLSKLDDQNVFWVARDITERKKSEEELRKSQEQYALAAEGANDGLWDWDIATNEIYYSPRWKSMLGYEVDELTKGFEDWERLIHPEDHDYAVNALDEYLTGKANAYDVEIRLGHKDGTWRWIRDRGKALRDANGKAFRMAGSHSDVTERKLAEESIRRRNEYLAVSSEIGKIVTSTLDINSIFARTVNLINERFGFYHASIFIVEETGFNATLREATGEAGAEMKRNSHSLQVNAKSIVGKVALEGNPVVVNDVLIDPIHKINPLLPETRAEAAIPLRIGNRVIGAIDIQAKNINTFTEDEITVLQTLADQVAVAIDNARSFELSQQAVMEMREIDRLKSAFLANMSHELRTPLNSIIGFSRVILKGIDGPITELQQQDLSAIYNSGQHLLGLINDILDLSKIEAGKMELAFDEVNIVDVTSSVLSTMAGLVKDKQVEMKRIIEPDLPTVRADAIRIRQVMINLLSNAAKFTDEGDILVEVSLKAGPTGRSEVQVSVTDTGPGISEEDQAKLFQPFSQVDDSPTRKTGGTGLGLSICQHLIDMHGGRIWIDSQVGKGSTFSFTLPLFRKEKESELLVPGINNKIILAIDDDPQVISLYERYLHPQGYQIIPLSDPKRAVERAIQLKPFAITLDIMMPGVDGWQVLDTLKSNPATRHIPIIVCSIIEDLERGFSLGAADYLVKPILEDDLVNSLDLLNSDGSIREVLVIDDDPNDLRLIGKILNDDGRYKATLAEGGRMGWDIISSGNPPHAVILDLFMPEINGFTILENMRAEQKLRDIPVIVISGMEPTEEQKNKLSGLGQRLLSKGSFSEKELLTTIQRILDRAQINQDHNTE